MLTYKALGALLTYPDEDLIEGLTDISQALAQEGLLSATHLARIAWLIDELQTQDLMDLQERYVSMFDRSRRLSLHLYEHLHGESRDRGTAMATLAELYRFHGFEMNARELPDYLPMVCEFLSFLEDEVARSVLADAAPILEALATRLAEKESRYAAVLAALVSLSAQPADSKEVAAILAATPADADSLEELDKAWEEEPVTFGPGDALQSCPIARKPQSPSFPAMGAQS
ncbi:MAG TPA: nitrate reductase molybdenum cofactor assembly chaperone [Azospirillum sp.]|nr:nitrate reductase molybdenum cofactor assembly chaperone [Azospirillum sp.]